MAGLDLLAIAVPAADVRAAVAEARAAGVGAAVIISAGFAETGAGGRELQARVVEAAGPMPVLGPNCLGLVSGPEQLRLTVNSRLERRTGGIDGPIAVISQSGAVGHLLVDALDKRGVGWSYFVSTGNEANLGLGDIGRYLLQQGQVQAVALYVESLRDVTGYRELGRAAAQLGKRVIVLKTGVSESSQRAALSHTASVAGDFLLFEGISDDEGIVLVRDEEELVEAAYATAHPVNLPTNPRLGVVTVSGGMGALLADQVADTGATVPELSGDVQRRLRSVHQNLASVNNPVDLAGTFPVTEESIGAVLGILDEATELDAVVFCYAHGEQHRDTFAGLLPWLAAARKPTWFIWAGGDITTAERRPTGLVFDSVPQFVRMFRRIPIHRDTVVLPRRNDGGSVSATFEDINGMHVLTERHAGPLLRSLGVRYPEMTSASRADDVVAAIEGAAVPGPWVLKADSPDLPHRAKLGLVELGIESPDQMREAAIRMAKVVEDLDRTPGALTYVAQRAVVGVAEFSIGMIDDPIFGRMLLAGPGGKDVEREGHRAACSIPLTPRGVARLRELVVRSTGVDVGRDAFAGLATAVSELAVRLGATELDVNPVLVAADGTLTAVDSLVVLGPRRT